MHATVKKQATNGPDWLDAVQQPPVETLRSPPALRPLLTDNTGLPAESLSDWEHRRFELLGQWKDFLGPIKETRDPSPGYVVLEQTSRQVVVS